MGHRLTITLVLLLPVMAIGQDCAWWEPPDGTVFHYRVKAEVVNGSVAKEDYPVWLEINFTDILLSAGVVGALDTASIRLIECIEGQDPFPNACLFEVCADFRKVAEARGTIAWLMDGPTAPEQSRTWHIYFDLEENGLKTPGPVLDGALLIQNANNLIANPSFEVDEDGDGMPDGWDGFAGGPGVESRTCSLAHWGERSLLVTASPGDSAAGALRLPGIVSGGLYKAGAYLRVEGSSPEKPEAVVAFPGPGRAVRFSTEASLPAPGMWGRSDVVVPAPTGTDTLTIIAWLETSPDTLLLDDLVVLYSPPTVQLAGSAESLPP
jgi:hypothetical protein